MPDAILTVSEATSSRLREIAERSGRAPAEILESAVKEYHRKLFWDATNAGYAAFRNDPTAWAEEQAERRMWDSTLRDGWLKTPSTILCDAIRSIDRRRLIARSGVITPATLATVEAQLRNLLVL